MLRFIFIIFAMVAMADKNGLFTQLVLCLGIFLAFLSVWIERK